MNLLLSLQEKIKYLVKNTYGVVDISFVVEHPENVEFGDYATNVAMVISKIVKQSPMEIAKSLGYKLSKEKFSDIDTDTIGQIFSEITTASPGFINFKLSQKWLLKLLGSTFEDIKSYRVNGERIALEHSNINPNKAAHVGHLRNACIGQFIERIYELQGFNVEVQYYANNVGVQVATSMMGMQNTTLSPTSYKKFDHYAWDVYAEMESKIAQDPKLQKQRLDILKMLEDPTSAESLKQREFADKILAEHLKTFALLGFDYDVIIYESDILAKRLWEKAFELLKVNENVYYAKEGRSAGCWLVRLGAEVGSADGNEVSVERDKIIVRSNGIATYTGKDIAYHMWKYGLLGADFDYKKWPTDTQSKDLWVTSSTNGINNTDITFSGVDHVFDVIGAEQTYAIDVVKQSLAFLGYEKQSQNMKHINYGFVYVSRETAKMLGIDISDGKKFYAMSGRKGWGVKVDDLIDMVDKKLVDVYGNFSAIKAVRNGAIKFSMLKLNTFQDLIFDLTEAMDIKGYSGPYVQYACVRANSILKKADNVSSIINFSDDFLSKYDFSPRETELMRLAGTFADVINTSSRGFAPNLLCEFLFDLSKKFNAFYNDMPILMAENEAAKSFRLALCLETEKILEKGLWLLGIDVPESM